MTINQKIEQKERRQYIDKTIISLPRNNHQNQYGEFCPTFDPTSSSTDA